MAQQMDTDFQTTVGGTQTLFEAGQYDNAIELLNTALSDYRIFKDKAMQLTLLLMLADAYEATGELDEAAKALEAALPLPDQTNQPRVKARILGRLGTIYADDGDLERSTVYTHGALDLATQLDDKQTIGELLCLLALNYRDMEQPTVALKHCEQAFELFRANKNNVLAAKALNLKRELQLAQRH
jgi:tetratricopeptide (TPR) repeat protein